MHPEISRAIAARRAADLMNAAEAHRQIRAARQAWRADHRPARRMQAQRTALPAQSAAAMQRATAPAQHDPAARAGGGGRAADECVGASTGVRRPR